MSQMTDRPELTCPILNLPCQHEGCAWWMEATHEDVLLGCCSIKRIAQAQDYQADWRQAHWNVNEVPVQHMK
jgi:hypothetical protein